MIQIDSLALVLGGLLVLACGVALWLHLSVGARTAALTAELGREREERERDAREAREQRGEITAERDGLRVRLDDAERRLAAANERMEAHQRERETMLALQKDVETRFQALADDALRRSQAQFLQVADETFKKHKEGAQGELGALLKPIQETFGQFREKVATIEKERTEDRAKLDEQIRGLGVAMSETQSVTGKLASALAAPRHGGRWGEETLRNVLEMSGLSPYADFVEQSSSDTEKGRQRPDVIVRMPGGRELVIDSKVSLDDYLAASNEADPVRQRERLVAHARRVREHVRALSGKDYWKEFDGRVDFVAMFIPGENFYAAVLEHDREIFDYASRSNVIIVTPSTLIALAKAVSYGWRQEQMAKNAEQAARLGRELYDRLHKMSEHMENVGGNLGKAVKSYNDMMGSLERRVLPAARKFEELSFADPSKIIPEPKRLDLLPHQPMLIEPQAERAAGGDGPAAPAGKRRAG